MSVHHRRASASPQLQCLEAHPACAVAGPSNNPPCPPIKGDFAHQYYFQPCFCWDFARWCWGARSWLGVFCSPVHVHGICSVWIVQSVFLHSTEMVFSFSFFCLFVFFNLKVSRGEPLGPVPPLYPPPTLQPPVAAVTSLVPGQRGSSTSLALRLSAPLWLHFVYSFCTAPQLCTSACAAGAGLQRVLPWAVSPAAASWSRAWPSCPAAACCRGPPVCSGPLAGSLEPCALAGLGSAGPPGAPALSSLCISFLSEGARRG